MLLQQEQVAISCHICLFRNLWCVTSSCSRVRMKEEAKYIGDILNKHTNHISNFSYLTENNT